MGGGIELLRFQQRDFEEIEPRLGGLANGVVAFRGRPFINPQKSVRAKSGHGKLSLSP